MELKINIESGMAFCYTILNSTRRASGRKAKLKSAGLVFYSTVLELANFVCYTIVNKPATPLNLRVKAHFRQALFFRELFI